MEAGVSGPEASETASAGAPLPWAPSWAGALPQAARENRSDRASNRAVRRMDDLYVFFMMSLSICFFVRYCNVTRAEFQDVNWQKALIYGCILGKPRIVSASRRPPKKDGTGRRNAPPARFAMPAKAIFNSKRREITPGRGGTPAPAAPAPNTYSRRTGRAGTDTRRRTAYPRAGRRFRGRQAYPCTPATACRGTPAA